MAKIRLFFLSAIFLITPIVYAWLYIPFVPGNLADIVHTVLPNFRWTGFESVKVFLFILVTALLLLYSFIEFLFDKTIPKETPGIYNQLVSTGNLVILLSDAICYWSKNMRKAFVGGLLILLIWSVSSIFLNQNTNPYFLTGNLEKTHGLFFYFALFFLFWLIRSLSTIQQKYLFKISFIGFWIVILYAFFQRFGLDPLTNAYNSRLDPWRLFSTLGNPNYLAWYVLLMLPLLRVYHFEGEVSWQEHMWEVSIWIISWLMIYWTGSYLAWMMFATYVGYTIISHVLPKTAYRKYLWFVIVLALVTFVITISIEYRDTILEAQKMKWFIARWYLWKTGFSALTANIGHFLFGYGPDGFLPVSEHFRHPLLSVYEDPAYRIDRSHNVFLDFWLHFWFLVTILTLWSLAILFRWLTHEKKVAICIFAIYFSFNIPVLIHFLIVTQIFASAKNELRIKKA